MFEVIKCREAFEQGKTRYFTGKPCLRGHIAQRMVSSGTCAECLKLTRAKWRKNNPEKRKRQARIYKATMRATNPEAEKARLVAFYARKENKKVEIAGRPRSQVCEICLTKGKTVFDHCHQSGNFRGWICDRCNKVLGLVYDDPHLLNLLAVYLGKSNAETFRLGAKEIA